MPIEILTHQVPQAITWFNSFVGFREIWTRIERVEKKLSAVDFASPILARRFFFHTNYKRIVVRNRTFQSLDLGSLENYRPISFIAGIRDAAQYLSAKAQASLKGNILDALSPDRDLRALEHEFRVYTHYRQLGANISFVDLEDRGNYDFDVSHNGVAFEVEAKTLNEDVGNLVSTEQSFVFFEAFKRSVSRAPLSQESGILTFAVHTTGERSFDAKVISETISDFLARSVATKQYSDAQLSFERRRDWDRHVRDQNFSAIRQDIFAAHESLNPHTMIVLGHGRVVMFCVLGSRPNRLYRGASRQLKAASTQLSGERPGLIWMHFLGLREEEFVSLRSDANSGERNAFTALAEYTFGSQKRRHVSRMRFSADSDQVTRSSFPLLSLRPQRTVAQQGPTYEMMSNVSKFDGSTFF